MRVQIARPMWERVVHFYSALASHLIRFLCSSWHSHLLIADVLFFVKVEGENPILFSVYTLHTCYVRRATEMMVCFTDWVKTQIQSGEKIEDRRRERKKGTWFLRKSNDNGVICIRHFFNNGNKSNNKNQ